MTGSVSSGNSTSDPAEFASGKVLTVLGVPADRIGGVDTVGFWIEAYLAAAVRGVRSAEVAGKIARHLRRFDGWLVAGVRPRPGRRGDRA